MGPVDDEQPNLRITDLGNEVYEIDTQMGGFSGITAGYLIRGDRPALIETGTARSAPIMVAALNSLGIGPTDLATIVVTHIHLDHAGGVGDLTRAFPQATVVVHERGARHLADPSRLVASAHRVFGDVMDTLFGDLLPTPAERLVSIGETGDVDLGAGRRLTAVHSPGHASHHLGLLDSGTGDLYTGDAAGLYIAETAEVRPSTPPPDFDLDLALQSLDLFRAMAPTRLLFSHYGPVADVDDVLARSGEEMRLWVEDVQRARGGGLDLDHAVAMVWEQAAARSPKLTADAELTAKFEAVSSAKASVQGIWRYLDQSDSAAVGQ